MGDRAVSRRQFLAIAAASGAAAAWAGRRPERSSAVAWHERRDLYPQGVASGDPDSNSVLLWTRRPFSSGSRARLRVEVSEDEAFTRIVARASTQVSAASDWTCRILVGNLRPARVYWYRFVDEAGNASRIGRTLTAPVESDTRPVRFAVVSCQNINHGALHAYRRMVFEDERVPEAERLGFVLHLGDFIYELVWYPEENRQGPWGRPLYETVRYPRGEKLHLAGLGTFHVPATLEDYRTVYRAYLSDPDLQDARARWPFVCMWDNHEFSGYGWQSFLSWTGEDRPGQSVKVAANQAWFEYQPARVAQSGGSSLEVFNAPAICDVPVQHFDEYGLGDEPNNRTAIDSLKGYRALRWGGNAEIIITDQRSYRSKEPIRHSAASAFKSDEFPRLFPQEAMEILDAGRNYADGKPPAAIRFADQDIANFRRDEPPQTLLGAEQKSWFLNRLKQSRATWKIWGSSLGTLDYRVDPQHLPAGLTRPWPGDGYATFSNSDYSTAYHERAEIYSFVRNEHITGFATVCGDRHSFWAGLAAPSLPPRPFAPVGVAFVTGSLSTPGSFEMMEHDLPKDHPLRALYLTQRASDAMPEPAINLLLRHGVRACLEYQRSNDIERARRVSNPDLSPHLSFVDLGGHGYATVRVSSDAFECEFVCIPRPSERIAASDGGPLLYRVVHRAPLWKAGERPRLEQRIVEGNPALSL